jgi:hypothetical protein
MNFPLTTAGHQQRATDKIEITMDFSVGHPSSDTGRSGTLCLNHSRPVDLKINLAVSFLEESVSTGPAPASKDASLRITLEE